MLSYDKSDVGDVELIGIGIVNGKIEVSCVKVFCDVYYI